MNSLFLIKSESLLRWNWDTTLITVWHGFNQTRTATESPPLHNHLVVQKFEPQKTSRSGYLKWPCRNITCGGYEENDVKAIALIGQWAEIATEAMSSWSDFSSMKLSGMHVLFQLTEAKSLITWNALNSGCCHMDRFEEAFFQDRIRWNPNRAASN